MMLTLFVLALLATPFLAYDFSKRRLHARSAEALEVQLYAHPEKIDAAIELYAHRINRYPFYWAGLLMILAVLAF